jgi:prevent-host-death family protein
LEDFAAKRGSQNVDGVALKTPYERTRLIERSQEVAMRIVNIHEAKTHLSRLIDRAAKGEPFIIAESGEPMVKLVAIDTPVAGETRRVGFMAGQFSMPEDFDRIGDEVIEHLFGGDT